MKKQHFWFLVLTMAAGLVFALGMCMCLVEEWNLFKPGVVVTGFGLIALLAIGLAAWIYAGRPIAAINWALTGKIAYGVASTLVLGAGMSMILVFSGLMIPGILVGIAGIVMLLGMIPICKGLK